MRERDRREEQVRAGHVAQRGRRRRRGSPSSGTPRSRDDGLDARIDRQEHVARPDLAELIERERQHAPRATKTRSAGGRHHFFFVLPALGALSSGRMSNEQADDADDERGVGDVERRPLVRADAPDDEVGDAAVGDAIDDVAERAAGEQAELGAEPPRRRRRLAQVGGDDDERADADDEQEVARARARRGTGRTPSPGSPSSAARRSRG